MLWLLDGLLQLQPKLFGPTFATWGDHALGHGATRPSCVEAIAQVAHLISVQPALVDALFAGVQLLIGVGLLIQDTVKPALVLSRSSGPSGYGCSAKGLGGLLTGRRSP